MDVNVSHSWLLHLLLQTAFDSSCTTVKNKPCVFCLWWFLNITSSHLALIWEYEFIMIILISDTSVVMTEPSVDPRGHDYSLSEIWVTFSILKQIAFNLFSWRRSDDQWTRNLMIGLHQPHGNHLEHPSNRFHFLFTLD